ncbi:hypothetical protein KDW99_11540 [Marinomonas rhizomae]|uniref:hypothetical protein n=1 Tax=Marinomonas rhizomae TaxID=491948 RepID=UPI002105D06A|nr:hypothetical protein [Marinomonas rhizomae]UTV97931.1 hypothetical protein KDW99_11540 [Marinomonas rhizomae]
MSMKNNTLKGITYQFRLNSEVENNAVLPDSFFHQNERPHPNFVVARDSNQKPISVYKDNKWDWTAYHPYSNNFILDFTTWHGGNLTQHAFEIVNELKWLMFIVFWISNGRSKAASTIYIYMRLFNKLAVYATSENVKVATILQEPKMASKFLDKYGDFYSTTLYSLLNIIKTETESVTSIRSLPSKSLNAISIRSQKYYTSHNQHPPIPTKILTRLLGQIDIALTEFDKYSEEYLNLTGRILDNNQLGINRSSQSEIFKKEGIKKEFHKHYRPIFKDIISETSISEYLLKNNINSKKQLLKHLGDILFLAKINVLAYSGMRHMEAANVKYDCLEIFFQHNKEHYLVRGETTKLNHGIVKQAKWVISTEAVSAIKIAKKIAKFTYKKLKLYNGTEESINNLLLFPGLRALNARDIITSLKPENVKYISKPMALSSVIKDSPSSPILANLISYITEEDIRELEQIDAHRDWRSEKKFVIGKEWTITAHQFRRSLALYATNSGLVSLPSLRRQLQHITNEMSAYYSKGSSFAKDILGCDSDFVSEYQKTIPESEALSYIKNILLSDEKLFGAHGAWLSVNKDKSSSIFFQDRDETKKKFENGQLHYQETVIGGCTGTSQCIERATRSIVACVECAGGIIVSSKLDKVISSQESVVSSLQHDSIVYRTEKDDLDKLIVVRERIKMKNLEV